jgi:hypothetical protein
MKTKENKNLFTEEETLVFSQKTKDTPKKEKKELTLWQSVLVGGVPGILLGAGSTFASSAMASVADIARLKDLFAGVDLTVEDVSQPHEMPMMETSHQAPSVPAVATSVTNEMSYSEAFAAARGEVGPGGAFVWHGNVYGTYRADDPEWQEMTSEERAAYSQNVLAHVSRAPYTPTEEEPEIEVLEQPGEADASEEEALLEVETVSEQDASGEEAEVSDIDVHIVSVEHIEAEDGSLIPVGIGEMNGQNAVFADTDKDGLIDTVMVDLNGNGQVDEGEIIELENPHLSIEDMQASVQADANQADLYPDMPDYTNDADTSSLE